MKEDAGIQPGVYVQIYFFNKGQAVYGLLHRELAQGWIRYDNNGKEASNGIGSNEEITVPTETSGILRFIVYNFSGTDFNFNISAGYVI